MRTQDLLAEALLANKQLVSRYLAGFDDTNHTRQAPGLPNHAAWNLGHLALTMHRVAEKLDGKPAPESDFAAAGVPAGQQSGRFSVESVSFGSKPGEERSAYPTLARCLQIFESACDRIAAASRAATDDKLAEMTAWGPIQTPLWQIVLRMSFHNGMHTGQLADLRRAFGFKSIFS